MKNFILALLPPYGYYEKLSIKADVFALRLTSQIDNKIKDEHDFVLFDGYIDKYLGQRHNEKAVADSLKHSVGSERDCSIYKGLSLVDINHAAIYCSVFLPCYREALAFLTLVDHFHLLRVIISADDPNSDIFNELAEQMKVEMEITRSFGEIGKVERERIKRSNRTLDIQELNWHPLANQPKWKQMITLAFNLWSKLIRMLRGKKPFVYIDLLSQSSDTKAQVSTQKKYYPIFLKLHKLPIINLLLSGFFVLQKQSMPHENYEVSEIIKNYKEHLEDIKNKKAIGQIEFRDKKYSIAGSIIRRLNKRVPLAFKQLADSIDIYEDFINKNKVSGAFLSSDMNWENRLVVRLWQKHNIKNMAHMNGWFGVKHMIENKSADQILCFGESYINNYFRGKDKVTIVGSPKFDAAYKKRSLIKPKYPIRKILITTSVFSPADINCRYSDSEIYLKDVLTVIKKYNERNNYKMHIAIRPHPSDSPDYYRWYLERLGFPEIELELIRSFQEIVSDYDLYIGSYSTTLFETAAMGIPVIFYHPCNQILYPPFDGSCKELPLALSVEGLEKIFTQVMEDRDYAYKFTDVKALKPYVGELDGNSASRVINEVIKMTEIR